MRNSRAAFYLRRGFGAPSVPPLQCSVTLALNKLRDRGVRASLLLAALWLTLATPIAVAETAAPVILIVGDSISAGYGLPAGSGWANLLEQRLGAEHYPQRVVNASISGDTTAGGRARIDALLAQYRPTVTVIELGGNDGLRGGSLDAMQANLDALTLAAQKAGSRVLLVGMRLPPNYGMSYVQRFARIYADVAKARKVALVPYFFDGFGEDNNAFQPDRIHPTVALQPRLLDNVWPQLKPLLGKDAAKR